jgi:uncharacterized protein YggE
MSVNPYTHDTTYATTEAFTVRIRDFRLLGAVIDTALGSGAQTISNVAFERTETRGPYLEALELATRNARENAETMVRASNAQLGRLLDLSTEPLDASPAVGYRLDEVAVTVRGAATPVTTIVAPPIRITVTVFGRWEVLR